MSEQSGTPLNIPQWTAADRLAKARTAAGLTQAELADLIGIGKNTVSNYETGATTHLRRIVLTQWAWHTHVPVEWLRDGVVDLNAPDPDGGLVGTGEGDKRSTKWETTVLQFPLTRTGDRQVAA